MKFEKSSSRQALRAAEDEAVYCWQRWAKNHENPNHTKSKINAVHGLYTSGTHSRGHRISVAPPRQLSIAEITPKREKKHIDEDTGPGTAAVAVVRRTPLPTPQEKPGQQQQRTDRAIHPSIHPTITKNLHARTTHHTPESYLGGDRRSNTIRKELTGPLPKTERQRKNIDSETKHER